MVMLTANTSLIRQQAFPLSSPEVVNVDEIPDLDTRLASMLQGTQATEPDQRTSFHLGLT